MVTWQQPQGGGMNRKKKNVEGGSRRTWEVERGRKEKKKGRKNKTIKERVRIKRNQRWKKEQKSRKKEQR